jgi:hypothetical protein
VHGRQERANKILKELQKTEKDKIQLNPITEKQWIRYYKELWTTEENNEYNVNCMTDENIDSITIEELNEALKASKIKIRKSPGYDGINIEIVKHAGLALHYRILDFLNICWKFGHVPEEWNIGIVILLFKKGEQFVIIIGE